ncbi:MAG: prephenate dehydratase domain-containing protein [Chlamydiota bacterium]
MKRVAYQGVKASFSETAIEKCLVVSEAVGYKSFKEVFAALLTGKVELAAIPIENTLIGPIAENVDLLYECDVEIVREYCMPIAHCLLVKSEQARLDEISQVISHPKALAQCTGFFESHPWIEPVMHEDTAGAAREIAEGGALGKGAIASRRTAEVYGLHVLKEHLEDDPSNTTRFVFLKRKGEGSSVGNKISLLFTLPHLPGALAEALGVLREEWLNLTQIVSRPLKGLPFEYLFFIEASLDAEVDWQSVIAKLKEKTHTLKVLGVYDAAL